MGGLQAAHQGSADLRIWLAHAWCQTMAASVARMMKTFVSAGKAELIGDNLACGSRVSATAERAARPPRTWRQLRVPPTVLSARLGSVCRHLPLMLFARSGPHYGEHIGP
jgi:hypothetical protein